MSESSPRIKPVDAPDEQQRGLLSKTLVGPDGGYLNLFTTLAHRPRLLRRINSLGAYFMVSQELAARDRELVILRTAAHARSTYEIGQHRLIAAQVGLRPAEIDAALDRTSPHEWAESDRMLLSLSDDLASSDTVSDAVWERLGSRYSDGQRMDLLVLVGYYRMLAGVLNGLRVELDESVAALR